MNKNARWLEWSEKQRMENQIKKEEFLKKQEEAGQSVLVAYQFINSIDSL